LANRGVVAEEIIETIAVRGAHFRVPTPLGGRIANAAFARDVAANH